MNPDGLYLWVIPTRPDTFFATTQVAKDGSLPCGTIAVIPTLLAASYWIHPGRLGATS